MSSTAKLVYQPDPQSTEEFILLVHPENLKKWRDGDEPKIPLTDVVASYEILVSIQGSQGLLNTPSKQQLETIFGKSQDEDPDKIHFVKQILERGSLKEQHVEYKKGATVKNATRSNRVVDTRGGRNTSGV